MPQSWSSLESHFQSVQELSREVKCMVCLRRWLAARVSILQCSIMRCPHAETFQLHGQKCRRAKFSVCSKFGRSDKDGFRTKRTPLKDAIWTWPRRPSVWKWTRTAVWSEVTTVSVFIEGNQRPHYVKKEPLFNTDWPLPAVTAFVLRNQQGPDRQIFCNYT